MTDSQTQHSGMEHVHSCLTLWEKVMKRFVTHDTASFLPELLDPRSGFLDHLVGADRPFHRRPAKKNGKTAVLYQEAVNLHSGMAASTTHLPL